MVIPQLRLIRVDQNKCLGKLEKFDFSYNNISTVDVNAFNDLSNLNDLDLLHIQCMIKLVTIY